jgi:hypothetical protein
MDFTHLFPALQPTIDHMEKVWPAPIIKPQFAFWEVLHIISLFMLSGALIAINLRLLGGGLIKESPSSIERNVRPWLAIGVIGAVVTGILIGMTNAQKLYESSAFLVKMIAMVAAIAFTYLVTVPMAKADGRVSATTRLWLIGSLAIWLVSLLMFSITGGINPGVIHIVMAAGLLIFISTEGNVRKLFTGGMVGLLVLQQVVTHLMIKPDNYDLLNPVNKGFTATEAVWILGFAAYQILGRSESKEGGSLTRLAAYASLLIWVTVGAGGRWIAFAA